MPSYKLHYFNGRGRGETIRLILTAAGQKFEDYRIELPDWANKKKDYKFGKLPVLEVDGEKLNQSIAICHYLATQHGLAGKTPFEAAKCHAAVETLSDFTNPLGTKVMAEKDHSKIPALIKNEIEPEVKKGLTVFEAIAKETHEKTKSLFWIGTQLTYADLFFQNTITTLIQWLGADYIKQFPHVQKFYDNISNQPKIKEYLAARSKTPF